jgi:inosine-uridine nucleoside N-ribohydrolase
MEVGSMRRRKACRAVAQFGLAAAVCGLSACTDSAGGSAPQPPRVIFSTDVANGLIDTHGGQGSCPVSFSASWPYMNDTDFTPQDVDDGFTLAMALNMDAADLVRVAAIVPTYGNASLPAEMIVARQITWNLKGRTDIPIVPGAMAPAGQVLRAAPQWFDGEDVPIASADGSFAAACRNSGVDLMRQQLLDRREPTTLLAIGPLTDVACLMTLYPDVAPFVREIIVLGSRVEGDSLTVNGKVVNDFNVRIDPLAGALLLAAEAARAVPIRLMAFRLTGQTSQADDLIALDASTLTGPTPPTPESMRSLSWLLDSSQERNEFWTGIFGTSEGPFDQYTLAAAVWPDLFDCRAGRAYIQQCPFPAWSPQYPTDASGDPTEEPYNTSDNPCVDHGAEHGASLSSVPAQLVVTLNAADEGPLVRGATGVDGNLPQLEASAREVTVCIDFASSTARGDFEDRLLEYTW